LITDAASIAPWIALFLGFYSLSAAVGELRTPNGLWTALKELERSPALRFLTGALSLILGAAIYLVTPWRPGDWLSIVVSVIGGLHVAQGALILASGERFMHVARAVLGRAGRTWAGFAALLGVILVLAALSRLQLA